MSCREKIALKHAAVPLLKKKSFELMSEEYIIQPKRDCNICMACIQKRNIKEHTEIPLLASSEHSFTKDPKCHDKILIILFTLLLISGIIVVISIYITESESNIIEEFDYVTRKDWSRSSTNFRNLPRLTRPVSKILLLRMTANCDSENGSCMDYEKFEENNKKKIKLHGAVLYNFYQGKDGKIFEGRGWGYQPDCDGSCNSTATIALLETDIPPPSFIRILKLKAFLNFAISNSVLKDCFRVIIEHSDNRYIDDIAFALEDMVKKDGPCKYNQ